MSQFTDICRINVKGGDGGAGCMSFRREAVSYTHLDVYKRQVWIRPYWSERFEE